MTDIYTAPESDVKVSRSTGQYGSIEQGLEGNYELSFGGVLSEAWSLTKGSKTTILVAVLLYMVFAIAISFVVGFVGGLLGVIGTILAQIVLYAVFNPVAVGMLLIGVKRACNSEASSSSIFGYFDKTLPVFLTYILMVLLLMVGFILLVLPGIYLMIAYMYALPLVVEKNMGPWEALETSRKIVTKKWFTVFGIYLVMGIIIFISMIPMGLGLIWTLPWFTICAGIIYRNAFGVEEDTIA